MTRIRNVERPTTAATGDADLIAACTAFTALEAEWRRLMAEEDNADDPQARSAIQAQLDAMDDAYHAAMEAIAGTPARTSAGLQAKAAAVLAFFGPATEGDARDDRMLWSVIHDASRRLT